MTSYENGSRAGYEIGGTPDGCKHCCAPRAHGHDYCASCEPMHDRTRPLWRPCRSCDATPAVTRLSQVCVETWRMAECRQVKA